MEFQRIDTFISENGIKSIFLVHGSSLSRLAIRTYIDSLREHLGVHIVSFSDFQPNPEYDSIVKGVELFNRENCDAIVAVGGGSAIDVAKCIRLFSRMDHSKSYMEQEIVSNDIPFIVMPTTAGTGSEATRFAVYYHNGEKQSATDDSSIPSLVIMDPSVLETLPDYQKKVTMLDAMCHAVESYWSVNSTEESKSYAKEALKLIIDNKDSYLANEEQGNANMLKAANIAGKAINISFTTAGHAMCYKITKMYDVPHGYAAALCVAKLWRYMIDNTDKCIDKRGSTYISKVFDELAVIMGGKDIQDGPVLFGKFLEELNLDVPKPRSSEDYDILIKSVNMDRMKNHPIRLDESVIRDLYHQIFEDNI